MEQKAGGTADQGEEMTQPYHVVPEIVVVSIEPIELRCSICDEDLDCNSAELLQDIIAAHLEKHRKLSGRLKDGVPTINQPNLWRIKSETCGIIPQCPPSYAGSHSSTLTSVTRGLLSFRRTRGM